MDKLAEAREAINADRKTYVDGDDDEGWVGWAAREGFDWWEVIRWARSLEGERRGKATAYIVIAFAVGFRLGRSNAAS